jgi:hypothetical protein
MKNLLLASAMALGLGLAFAPINADAAGCLKGAAVGGVAGHVAGHHGTMGAAAGCAVGHHEASKKQEQTGSQAQNTNTDNSRH